MSGRIGVLTRIARALRARERPVQRVGGGSARRAGRLVAGSPGPAGSAASSVAPHPLTGLSLAPWAFEQIMRMKEAYDPNQYEIGATCPIGPIVETVLKNEVVIPDPFGPYEYKGVKYRLDVQQW